MATIRSVIPTTVPELTIIQYPACLEKHSHSRKQKFLLQKKTRKEEDQGVPDTEALRWYGVVNHLIEM